MKRSAVALGVAAIILLAAALAYYHFQLAPRIRAGRLEARHSDPSSRPGVSGFRYETRRGIEDIGNSSGRVVVVDVWASWCPPCVEGIPRLVALAERYRDAPFDLLGLSVDSGGWEDLKPFLERHPQINYRVAVPHPAPAFQLNTLVDLGPLGNVAVLPTFFVIDPQGRLAGKFVGSDGLPEVSDLVGRLLGNSSDESPGPDGRAIDTSSDGKISDNS
jgi:thiol-disulfide isomerase/thioredoxin